MFSSLSLKLSNGVGRWVLSRAMTEGYYRPVLMPLPSNLAIVDASGLYRITQDEFRMSQAALDKNTGQKVLVEIIRGGWKKGKDGRSIVVDNQVSGKTCTLELIGELEDLDNKMILRPLGG